MRDGANRGVIGGGDRLFPHLTRLLFTVAELSSPCVLHVRGCLGLPETSAQRCSLRLRGLLVRYGGMIAILDIFDYTVRRDS